MNISSQRHRHSPKEVLEIIVYFTSYFSDVHHLFIFVLCPLSPLHTGLSPVVLNTKDGHESRLLCFSVSADRENRTPDSSLARTRFTTKPYPLGTHHSTKYDALSRGLARKLSRIKGDIFKCIRFCNEHFLWKHTQVIHASHGEPIRSCMSNRKQVSNLWRVHCALRSKHIS